MEFWELEFVVGPRAEPKDAASGFPPDAFERWTRRQPELASEKLYKRSRPSGSPAPASAVVLVVPLRGQRVECTMAHNQPRKRSHSRSRSDSRSKRDAYEKKKVKKRRKSSKDSRSKRSQSLASKRGPESERLRLSSASARDVEKKKKDKKRRKTSSASSSSSFSETTSSSSTLSSSFDSSPEESGDDKSKPQKKKQSKKKLPKEKDKKQKKRQRKKKAKRKAKKKMKEREKEGKMKVEELPGPSLDQWQRETVADPAPALTDEQKSRIRAMKPMTKEEWDARQSVIRRVTDPKTGRTRLIKGDGEVLEEIVTKERHKEINKQATRGDGLSFQMRTGMLQ